MKNKAQLPFKIQVLYGIGVSYAIVDQIFAQWVLYYYLPPSASTLEPLLPPIFISLALVISRFVDMIFDPLVGHWSDRVNSRWGRRIPFIAVGAVPLIFFTLAFFFPITTSDLSTFIYLTIVGSLFFVFYTVVGAPYNALIPEISKTRIDRLNLSTWQSVFRLTYTAIAMILPGIMIEILGGGDDQLGIRWMVAILGIISLIGMYITVFTIPERKYSGGKSSNVKLSQLKDIIFSNRSLIFYLLGLMFFFLGFNILRAAVNYYVEDIMGYGKGAITIASALLFGSAALSFYPVNKLTRSHGYKKLQLIFLVLLIFFCGALFSLDRILPAEAGFLIFFLIGIPVSGSAFIFPPAMLSEISAVAAERKKVQVEGVFFGLQGFFLKMAFLLSIAILPVVLVYGSEISLTQALVRTPEGVERAGIYTTSIVAAISFSISFFFYSFYKEEVVEEKNFQ